jgi:anti-sigma factor RsiW
MSDPWSDRLSEYMDGDLPVAETRALERHLAECEACRTALAELKTVLLRLSSDPVTPADQPTEREWARIRRAMSPARRRWLVPAALAASLLGMAVTGGLLLRGRESTAPAALYLQATADLEAVLRDNRSRLRPETVKAMEESMTQIDAAIAQAERALKADPANDYLTRYLGELHQARMMTLRQAVAVVHLKS